MALLSMGDIVVLHGFAIAQLSSAGTLRSAVQGEPSWSGLDQVELKFFQSDGRHVLAQAVNSGVSRCKYIETQVVRFTATNSVDSTSKSQSFDFTSQGGCANFDTISGAAIRSDGKSFWREHTPWLCQHSHVLMRLNSDGSFDSTFGAYGTVTNNLPSGTSGADSVVVPQDGKILAIGMANSGNDITLACYRAQ
jgi:hypothetical protein